MQKDFLHTASHRNDVLWETLFGMCLLEIGNGLKRFFLL